MSSPTSILGINAWHPDAAACLIVDGKVVAAAEEERFRRIKHLGGFPREAVRWCIAEAGIGAGELDWVAINRDTRAQLLRKVGHTIRRRPGLGFLRDRWANRRKVGSVLGHVGEALGGEVPRAQVANVEHHRAHLASSFLVSPFDSAAVVSVDGFGDFSSSAWGVGRAGEIDVRGRVAFPHSLGQFYLAVTQYLGFPNYGDEYKVMGMAAYGEPRFGSAMEDILRLGKGGAFRLDLRFFRHHDGGAKMTWDEGVPRIGRTFSPELEELLGPAREPGTEVQQRHFDIAASLQRRYEQALFHLLREVAERTGEKRLCLAGGCAMNGLANGRIREETPFTELYVPPAPGDAGGAMGAALDVWCRVLGRSRGFELDHAYLGPRFESGELGAVLNQATDRLQSENCEVRVLKSEPEMCAAVAERIADGGVVGWFQERMEWGPRALGNRSILADPRRADIREHLNRKIKLREGFRPFAPSVMSEHAGDWFDLNGSVPFMLEIKDVHMSRRDRVPGITHVDGTGRLQTVNDRVNPRYHALIRAFHERTGVPMLLNTSFNENEPVVCRPEEALDCFLRTNMDVLVMGDFLVERKAA